MARSWVERDLADVLERCRVEARSSAADLERLRRSLATTSGPGTRAQASILVASLLSLLRRNELQAERLLSELGENLLVTRQQ